MKNKRIPTIYMNYAINNKFLQRLYWCYVKVSLEIKQFVWQIYSLVDRYRRFQQMSRFLGRKECVQNFSSISQKLRDLFTNIQYRPLCLAKLTQLVRGIIYIHTYVHILQVFPLGVTYFVANLIQVYPVQGIITHKQWI